MRHAVAASIVFLAPFIARSEEPVEAQPIVTPLEGTWRSVSIKGKPDRRDVRYVFAGDTWTVIVDGERELHGTVRVEGKASGAVELQAVDRFRRKNEPPDPGWMALVRRIAIALSDQDAAKRKPRPQLFAYEFFDDGQTLFMYSRGDGKAGSYGHRLERVDAADAR